MSVLNQKMDEQMPYFKRVPGGEEGRGQGVSHTRCSVATAETAETEMETGAAQGVPQVQAQWGLGSEWGRGRAWLALHSSIKMRSVVCPKHKHTKLAPVELRLFIINTKKTPRTNCSRCWACLQPPAGPLSASPLSPLARWVAHNSSPSSLESASPLQKFICLRFKHVPCLALLCLPCLAELCLARNNVQRNQLGLMGL